jgi:hypothetical protein
MRIPLEELARRAEADEFFLACPLRWFARSQSFTDQQLAEFLGCSRETLVKVRLCGTPATEQPAFGRDVAAIAAKFGLNERALKKAVRQGSVVLQMQSAPNATLAARDRSVEDEI